MLGPDEPGKAARIDLARERAPAEPACGMMTPVCPPGSQLPAVALSVVVPVYNESHRLPATLERVAAYLALRDRTFEVLVVDDGSTDGTAQAARVTLGRLGIRGQVLRHEPNRGKGASVRRGMLAAGGRQVLFTDADLSTPIEEIERLEAALGTGAHVAIGSRAIDRSTVEKRQNPLRDGLGRLFNLVVRTAVLPGIRDSQCGFKLFAGDAVEPIFSRQRIDGFGFDVEALAIARALGYSIAEVPVRWINDPDSRVGVLQGAKAFLDPLRVRVRLSRGDYRVAPEPGSIPRSPRGS
jgi:dolichyl-phosphate beta-glucosyltransferase